MPIREESFRVGSGRYLQGKGYISRIGEEVCRLGSAPLVIGGKTALGLTCEQIEGSLKKKCNIYEIVTHTGTCNDEDAKVFANLACEKGYDVIVGVGGGVICDFAKLCAYYSKLPVINIPTSSATCAAYTPLSVRYTRDGRTTGTLHYEYEVDCVIADTEIIANQPIRLLLAGVFDSLAKFVEIKQRFTEDTKEYPTGLDYAYVMSKYSFNFLNQNTQKCIDDMLSGNISDVVENVIFTAIAATGVISGIARGSNQTAIAHKFYEMARFFYPKESGPYTHGEIVGVGLLAQNHFNGEEENNRLLLDIMKRYNMPYCITDIGVEKTEAAFDQIFQKVCTSSAINKEDEEECTKYKNALRYLWSLEKEKNL